MQAESFTCWQWRSFRRSPERAPGVQPSLLIWKLRAISRVQQCFTLLFFFHFTLTRLMGKKGKKRHKQPWSCVQSQSISQAKSHRLNFGKVGRLSGPAHPAGQWQRINQTSSSSSRGLSFTHLISHQAAHKPDCPASRDHSVNKNPCTKHHAQYGWFCSAGPSDRGQRRRYHGAFFKVTASFTLAQLAVAEINT